MHKLKSKTVNILRFEIYSQNKTNNERQNLRNKQYLFKNKINKSLKN